MTTPKAFKLPELVQRNNITPDANDDLAELCRSLTRRAVGVLTKIMEDDSATVSARVTAATTILDRAHGKPAQTIQSTSTDLTALHLAALKLAADDQRASREMRDITP